MSKTLKFFGSLFLGLVFFVALGFFSQASAADQTIDKLTIKKHILFDRYYDGWGGTGSQIYDNNDLFITSDDNIDLWAPQRVLFRSDAYWRRNFDGWDGTMSRIYDNKNMHIATDDFLFLDAPVKTIVQNHLDVNGTLQVYGMLVANSAVDFSAAGTVIIPSVSITGDVDLNGYDIKNVDDLYVEGNGDFDGTVYAENGLDVSGANLNVGPFNVNYVNGNISTTGYGWINGGLSVNGAFLADSAGNLTVNGTANFKDALYNSIGGSGVMVNDNLEISGDIYTYNIYPLASDNFRDIGGWNQRYQYGYFGKGLYAGSNTNPGDVYTYVYNQGITTYNQNLFVRATGAGSVTINPDGAVFLHPGATSVGVTYSRHIIPTNDVAPGSYDLGSSSYEWRNLYLSNYLDVADGSFYVTNAGNVFANGTLQVNGLATLDGGIDVGTPVVPRFTVSGANGNTYVSGTLQVDGLATLDGGIDVGKVQAFTVDTSGNVTAAGNVDIGGGYISTGSTLYSNGNLSMNGDLTVDGMIYGMITGNLTGNADTATYAGSAGNSDTVDSKHVGSGTMPYPGPVIPTDPNYFGGRNVVLCNIPTGLSSISSITTTIELNTTIIPVPLLLNVMTFIHSDTINNVCNTAPVGPAPGFFHAIIYDNSGILPNPGVPAGAFTLHFTATQ